MRRVLPILVGLLLAAACSRPAPPFSVTNAQAHVRMLAGTIGSRPTGTDANRRAREYLVERLRAYGFDVRVQNADAEHHGTTARVSNIIATRPGRRAHAIGLVSHYDSVPDGPGAADDALGVAVCLEAGRVLNERAQPNYALAVILTDGEEAGLMGAAAIGKDPIAGWLRAVLNFDAAGSGQPAPLFETGPGSRVLLDAWASTAPRPAGSSYLTDIYKVLPNATDFDLLARARLPGLNFAAVGDSYCYHTARDSTNRLDPALVSQLGENAVATVARLDEAGDLSDRTDARTLYSDLAGRWAFVYGGGAASILLAGAVLAGLFGWLTVLPVARQVAGTRAVLLTFAWVLVGVAAVFAAMVGAAWLLRATRETWQPWYAHPDRFFVYLVVAGILGGRVVLWIGRLLPPGLRGSAQPAVAWALILPVWLALAVLAQIVVPSGAYLAVFPLLAAGAGLVLLPIRRPAAIRVASAVVVGVAGLLCVRNALVLLEFIVAALGRAPVVTPLFLYPALLLVLGVFVVPPLVALLAGWGRVVRNRLLVALFVFAAAWCWFARAYTEDRPLQASIAYVNDLERGRARWQIGSNEPGIHVGLSAAGAGGWQPGPPLPRFDPDLGVVLGPFVFSAATTAFEPPPLTATGSVKRDGTVAVVEVSAVPHEPALAAVFSLPRGLVPEETNLTGRQQEGSSFVARYVALPAEGVTLRARISGADAASLEAGARATVLVVRNGLPGATWPDLPRWLPREHVTWQARSYFVIPVPLAGARQ